MTRFHKTAEYTAKDETRQVALGGLWVPDRVDTQGDYIRAGPLRDAAEDYMRRLQRGEAGQNIMHAVDGGDKLSLVENRILESTDTVGGTEFPAGSWVPGVKAHDDELWQLFEDNVFSGFSVGGEIIDATEMALEDVPADVHIPDGYDADTVTRIDEARIDEFSPVDEPAVPMARVEVLKDMGKNSAELADPETCHAALVERGHDEETAARICDVMHKDAKQELPPEVAECKDSVLEDNPDMTESEAIAICRDQLGMAADTDDPKGEASARMTDDEQPADKTTDVDDETLGRRIRRLFFGESGAGTDTSADAAKAGRTLSSKNEHEMKAAHDHVERVLESAGIDEPATARTYHDDRHDAFTLDYHDKSASESKAEIPMPDEAQLLYPTEEAAEAAAEAMGADGTHEHELDGETFWMPGETHDEFQEVMAATEASADKAANNQSMSDDDTLTKDSVGEMIDDRLEEFAKQLGDDVESETDDAEKADETEAPEWAKGLVDSVGELEDRVDAMSKASADTQQAEGSEKADEPTEKEAFLKGLVGGN